MSDLPSATYEPDLGPLDDPATADRARVWLRDSGGRRTDATLMLVGDRLVLEIQRAIDEEAERRDLAAECGGLDRMPRLVRYGPVGDQMSPKAAWKELREEAAKWPLALPFLAMILIATRTVYQAFRLALTDGNLWDLAIDKRYRRLVGALVKLGDEVGRLPPEDAAA